MELTKLISKFLNSIRLFGKIRHKNRIRTSKKVIKKVKEISNEPNSGGRIIGYLRKINPYVFEEVILTAIENSNIRITRNKQYSNDGGIDGKFTTKHGKVLIQCKRYKSYINNKDVIEFIQKIEEHKCSYGIFAHTGKTGDKAKNTAVKSEKVIYVSGSYLNKIITGEVSVMELITRHQKSQFRSR